MASYDSDLQMVETDDREYLIRRYATYLSFDGSCNEVGYELTLKESALVLLEQVQRLVDSFDC
jgi:hypothetical protein